MYLDTGVVPDQDTGVQAKFYIPTVTNSALFGAARNASSQYGYAVYNTTKWWDDYNDDPSLSESTIPEGTHVISKMQNVTSLDDVVIYTHSAQTFTCYNSMAVYAMKTVDGGVNRICASGLKYAYLAMYSGDTLTHYYIPIQQGDTCTMLDLMDNTLTPLPVQGTGTFTIEQ